MGTNRKKLSAIIKVVEESYQALFGKKTPTPTGLHASIWTDTNIYNEMGIPACKFGLAGGRWNISALSRSIIEDIYQATQVYACAALEICNWEKAKC
jgi:acetylornithine deacetylase/succinyl-diaminopimelate desuccinylase-like protein